MRAGVVLFDLDNFITAKDGTSISLDRAWASVAGAPARRIQSPHDLDSDVVWYTNLNHNQMWQARLHEDPKVRTSGWLRTSLFQLADELGLDAPLVAPDVAASALATLANRVVEVAHRDYGVRPQSRYQLNDDFASQLGAPKSAIPDDYYDPCFKDIAEHVSVRVVANQAHSGYEPTVTFRTNRVRHAREILATPVPPDTGWRAYAPGASEDLSRLTQPFLVDCKVIDVRPAVAEVLSWGVGAKRQRSWVTDIEWRALSELADVQVKRVMVCDAPAAPVPQAALVPAQSHAELSMTAGLIAEQVWTAITMSRPYRGADRRYTAAAAWLRAADRMRMFHFAQSLYAQGLNVSSYGVGNVVVRYPEGGLGRALRTASNVGLLPPASKVALARRAEAA